MIFSENFLSVEIFLEWKWAFKPGAHTAILVGRFRFRCMILANVAMQMSPQILSLIVFAENIHLNLNRPTKIAVCAPGLRPTQEQLRNIIVVHSSLVIMLLLKLLYLILSQYLLLYHEKQQNITPPPHAPLWSGLGGGGGGSSMLFLNSWRVSSLIVRYDTNHPAIQKQH